MKIPKPILSGIGNREGFTKRHNEFITDALDYKVNRPGLSLDIFRLVNKDKYSRISETRAKELITFTNHLLSEHIPLLKDSIMVPLPLMMVIGRLWAKVPTFSCCGWGVLWHLEVEVQEDKTVRCYAVASKIISNRRYIANIEPGDYKTGDTLFSFYGYEAHREGRKNELYSDILYPEKGLTFDKGLPGKHRDKWMFV